MGNQRKCMEKYIDRKAACQHRASRAKNLSFGHFVLTVQSLANLQGQACRVTVTCWPSQENLIRCVNCVSPESIVSRVSLKRQLHVQKMIPSWCSVTLSCRSFFGDDNSGSRKSLVSYVLSIVSAASVRSCCGRNLVLCIVF